MLLSLKIDHIKKGHHPTGQLPQIKKCITGTLVQLNSAKGRTVIVRKYVGMAVTSRNNYIKIIINWLKFDTLSNCQQWVPYHCGIFTIYS